MDHRGEVRPLNAAPAASAPTAAPVARWADRAALGAFFIWAAVYATRRLGGADYWWHLAFGRYVWEHRALPEVDVFTFTHHGAPWVNVSWLADLLLYGFYSLGGVAAMGALVTILILGSHVVMAGASHRAGRSILFIPAAALALGLHWGRFVLRPFLISSLLTATVMLLIERDRRRSARGEPTPGRALWLLVPLAWFWACSHGAFVILYGLIGAYGLEVLWQQRPARDADAGARTAWRLRFRKLVLLGMACAVATVAQPYGFTAFGRIAAMMGSEVWRTAIGEWQHTWEYAARSPQLAMQWYGLWALILVSFVAAGRRGSLFRGCVVAGMGVLAFDAVRHLDIFLYIAVPAVACNFHDAWEARGARVREWLRARGVRTVGFALGWAVLVAGACGFAASRYVVGTYVRGDAQGRVRAWATAPGAYPAQPMSLLLARPTSGRVFNSFEHGGYVFWRQYPKPVFIDSKGLDERQFLDYVDILNSHEAFQAATETHNLRAVVMPLAPRWADLYVRLQADPAWRLELLSPDGYLFTRRQGTAPSPSPEGDLATFIPPPVGLVDAGAARVAPNPIDARAMGQFLTAAGMPKHAAVAYGTGIKLSPHHAPTRLDYANLLVDLGHGSAALAAVEGVDRRAGRDVAAAASLVRARVAQTAGDLTSAVMHAEAAGRAAGEPGFELRLQLRLQQGDAAGAVAEGRRWVRRYRRSATARNNLAVALNTNGDSDAALRAIGRAGELAPARGDIQYTRGLILQGAGDAAGAAEAFAAARRMGFTSSEDGGR